MHGFEIYAYLKSDKCGMHLYLPLLSQRFVAAAASFFGIMDRKHL